MIRYDEDFKVVRVTPFGTRIEVGISGTLESCEIYCDRYDWEWKHGGIVNGLNVVPIWTLCERG